MELATILSRRRKRDSGIVIAGVVESQNYHEALILDWLPDDIYGRWIASWRSLEEPEEAPAEVRWTVLRIGYDPGNGFGGLTFSEV